MDKIELPSDEKREFDKFYKEYHQKIYKIVLCKINDSHLAEDIVQEIFWEAWRHNKILKDHPNKMGWLYRTALYKIREFMRRVGQCEEYFEDEGEADISVEEDGYCKAEMNLIIFETLTSDEQMRFRRYFLWGESIAEIAEKENVTENNMRVRISRLKKKMEQAIK